MNLGKLLIAVGLGIGLVGVILAYAPQLLHWFGRLPGDIRIERENLRVYFPLTSMLLVSAVLTLILGIFGRK